MLTVLKFFFVSDNWKINKNVYILNIFDVPIGILKVRLFIKPTNSMFYTGIYLMKDLKNCTRGLYLKGAISEFELSPSLFQLLLKQSLLLSRGTLVDSYLLYVE